MNLRRRIRRKFTAELKFADLLTRGEFEVIRRILQEIVKRDCKIIATQIHTGSQVIPDTPENYAVLVSRVVKRCLNIYPGG